MHNYGVGRCFASVHCEVPAEEDILKSHDIIDNIERDFLEHDHIHLVIHLDPVVTQDERTEALHRQVRELVGRVYPQVSIHDFRVVWGITHSNVLFDVAAPFSLADSDQEIQGEAGGRGVPAGPQLPPGHHRGPGGHSEPVGELRKRGRRQPLPFLARGEKRGGLSPRNVLQ